VRAPLEAVGWPVRTDRLMLRPATCDDVEATWRFRRLDDVAVEVADQARGVQAELGWVLHPDHAGHGYATEAVRGLVRLCFEDLGLRRVTASCFADNVASWRLMERLGMRRETYTVRESLHRSGDWLDGMGYALLAEEWTPA
jgi:RimJ/RimL family protein N-acetyltransferase